MKIKVFVFVFLLAVSSAVSADVIYLKSGKQITGSIVGEEDDFIKVDVGGVIVTLYNEDFDQIIEDLPDNEIVAPSLEGQDLLEGAERSNENSDLMAEVEVAGNEEEPESMETLDRQEESEKEVVSENIAEVELEELPERMDEGNQAERVDSRPVEELTEEGAGESMPNMPEENTFLKEEEKVVEKQGEQALEETPVILDEGGQEAALPVKKDEEMGPKEALLVYLKKIEETQSFEDLRALLPEGQEEELSLEDLSEKEKVEQFAVFKAYFPQDVMVKSVTLLEDGQAVLAIEGTVNGKVQEGTVFMKPDNGQWNVIDILWDNPDAADLMPDAEEEKS